MDRLDPRVDEGAVDPARIMVDIGGVAARAAAILGALTHAGIPLGWTTLQALGAIFDALNNAMVDDEDE